MWLLRISTGLLIILNVPFVYLDSESDKRLERTIMKGYNSRIRPVKLESTVTQVSVYLTVSHVERIDEREQTMLVHGHLWASWTDEYLTWKREDYNDTSKVQIQAWRIWQPALSLYNSAKGNAWHLYMNGFPATVYNTGKVWASGTYSFYVTCQFDFADWPFDTQKCPIVIADWVYGLNQVNLSESQGRNEYMKPTIRLSYDPIDQHNKRHVGGWEIMDSWRKHCYWGPRGCKQEQPEGEAEWYWSLLEFGIVMKRHLPYFGATIFIPMLLTTTILLCSFWIDTFSINLSLIIFNVLLQGLYGWEMISKMPPGSGRTPKIVQLYSMNLILSLISFSLTVVVNFLQSNLPSDFQFNFGFDITELPKKLKIEKLFESKGISFDPQELLKQDLAERESICSSSTSIGTSDALITSDDPRIESFATSSSSETHNDGDVLIPLEEPSTESPGLATNPRVQNVSKLQLQMHTIKRSVFIMYLTIYLFAFLYCLIF